MLLRTVFILAFGLTLILYSCAPEHSQITLAKFGNQDITMKDFENAYVNNVGSFEQARKDSLDKLKNFLNLYVNFQMKLKDAYEKGYDKDSVLQKELLDYKKKVGVSYILEKQLVDPVVHRLYERRKWEYRLSIILIRPNNNDPLAPKKLAEALLDSLKNGADFAALAKKNSQDGYSSGLGGDIFYVTAGEAPTELENAFYATDPGHLYPQIIPTNYGYFIIKVTDKRLRVPEVKGSHIIAAFRHSATDKPDTLRAKLQIDSAMTELKAGVDFAKVAEKFSDDKGTKSKGGDFGYFNIRQPIRPLAEALFSLKNIGDISGIIESPYGYHIVKLTDRRAYPSFDDDKENLKNLYKKTSYQSDYDSLIGKLKSEYNLRVNEHSTNYLATHTDTTSNGGTNPPNLDAEKNSELFTYADTSKTINDLLIWTSENPEFSNKKMTAEFFKDAVSKFSENALLEQEAINLDKHDPEFASLMTNYKDGIFIFKLQEDEIWNKVKVDSLKLKDYFLSTKDNYKWPDRVNYAEIFSRNDSLIHHYYDLLKEGVSFDSLASKYNEKYELKDRAGEVGLQDVDSSEVASDAYKLEKPGDYSKPIKTTDGYYILRLIEKNPAHPKSFEEARPEISGAYQEAESKILEKSYLDNLSKIYKPKLYYDELDQAFKSN